MCVPAYDGDAVDIASASASLPEEATSKDLAA
jgi:iron complex transport system ATP-binding protein